MEQEVFVHAYEVVRPIVLKASRQYFIQRLVGSEMCIRDRLSDDSLGDTPVPMPNTEVKP